jgi:uncharacterized protein (TIGR02145 family)
MYNFKKKTLNKPCGWFCLLALLLCACVKMPEHCSDYNPVNSSNQFCFGGRAYDKCGGREYNPNTQRCVGGTVRNVWTLTVNSTAGGTVTPSSPQSNIAAETPVNITAASNSGYRFVNWTVVSGTAVFGNADSASTTVTLSSNATIRANFQLIPPTYTLTVNRDPIIGGTVTQALQSGITAGTPVTITATPASGYTFVNWMVTSGTAVFGNADNASTAVTLSSNATVRANFEWVIVSDSFTDSRDGRTYRTVTIGTQTWMAENLNFNASGSVCYDNLASNCNLYGRLYNWAQAMNLPSTCNTYSCAGQVQSLHQGICPNGWHVPSDAEWQTLVDHAGGTSVAGARLRSTTHWHTGSGHVPSTDNFGFSALPGGYRLVDFYGVGNSSHWWCATERDVIGAWGWATSWRASDLYMHGVGHKADSFSLRCIAD